MQLQPHNLIRKEILFKQFPSAQIAQWRGIEFCPSTTDTMWTRNNKKKKELKMPLSLCTDSTEFYKKSVFPNLKGFRQKKATFIKIKFLIHRLTKFTILL